MTTTNMTRDYREIPLDRIDCDPGQPRTVFNETALLGLADSIRQRGVIQPIEVEPASDGRYRLHHGERRVRAARMAGLTTIPAIVTEPQDEPTRFVRAVLENLQREDLNPIEEARAYQRLAQLGWTRRQLSRELGRSIPHITGRLAWLEMESQIQDLVAAGRLPRDGRLAEKLRLLPPAARVALAEKLATRAVSLAGSLKAVDAAVEKLSKADTARTKQYRYREPVHATPMFAHALPSGSNGTGTAPAQSIREAAEGMCRVCDLRPRTEVIPSLTIVQAAATATCTECQKRDGPALPDICRRCPGVALLKRLLTPEVAA